MLDPQQERWASAHLEVRVIARGEVDVRVGTIGTLGIMLVAVGCSSNGGSGGSGGTGGGAPTVTYAGVVSELQLAGEVPIEGVKLCIVDHPEVACATSDVKGAYSLELPANTRMEFIVTKDTFASSITFHTTGLADDTNFNGTIISESTLAILYAAAAFKPLDPAKGTIAAFVDGPDGKALAGATVAISSMGEGPAYTKGSSFDPMLTTTDAGGVAFGNVTPGAITLTVSAANLTCAPGRYGWTSTKGTADGVVAPASVSFFVIKCV